MRQNSDFFSGLGYCFMPRMGTDGHGFLHFREGGMTMKTSIRANRCASVAKMKAVFGQRWV